VADSLVRLSVGLEEAADLISDLENAFISIPETKITNKTVTQ
jgi:cystathionine beta-lyase/cystathionine gamma-synthase